MAGFVDRVSYARSLCITAPLIFIATAIMASISLAGSRVDSSGRFQHGCARLWARMVLAISRAKVRVHGDLPFQRSVPRIFFVNHQSHMDIPALLAALPIRFRFAA